MKRRDLLKAALALGAAAKTSPSSAGHIAASGFSRTSPNGQQPSTRRPDADYIVVGSGAGGGTVAARLAEAGYTVLVLEAGGDPHTLSGGDPLHPNTNALPQDYDVPAFHPLATENDH